MYQVFTDGSSSKKNKTIGTSYIVFKNKDILNPLRSFSKGFSDKQARNGVAELLGVYYFLYHICCEENVYLNKNEEIVIYSDSQYVVNEFNIWFRNQMLKNFYDIKNKEIVIYILWMLYILREEEYIIKFKWIKGHQKEETFEAYGNNKADLLAVSGRLFYEKITKLNKVEDVELIMEKLKQEIKEEEIFPKIKNFYLGI